MKSRYMKPHRLGLALSAFGVCVLGAALFVSLAGAGSSGKTGTSASNVLRANFISSCKFSHQSNDDPIVYPNQFGKSHLHQFVGNDTTNAASTLSSLQAGTTSCRRSGDTAAYWAPALIQGTTPVAPMGATIYYRRSTTKTLRASRPG